VAVDGRAPEVSTPEPPTSWWYTVQSLAAAPAELLEAINVNAVARPVTRLKARINRSE
jgi:hypothetical protein